MVAAMSLANILGGMVLDSFTENLISYSDAAITAYLIMPAVAFYCIFLFEIESKVTDIFLRHALLFVAITEVSWNLNFRLSTIWLICWSLWSVIKNPIVFLSKRFCSISNTVVSLAHSVSSCPLSRCASVHLGVSVCRICNSCRLCDSEGQMPRKLLKWRSLNRLNKSPALLHIFFLFYCLNLKFDVFVLLPGWSFLPSAPIFYNFKKWGSSVFLTQL